MVSRKKLLLQVRSILRERGQKSLDKARQVVMQVNVPFSPLQEALQFFILGWEDILHPALLSLACEAVGGNPDATPQIGAALVLLAGGADVHDDLIDQSTVKDSKPTVFGKFGKDLTVLVGDALLFEGLYLLHEACKILPKDQQRTVLDLTKQAFFRISSAEAKEASLRGRTDSAEEYMEMIKLKAAVGETTTKIGAILGGGTLQEIEILGHYGKTLATLLTIRDEFADTHELDELKSRVEKECLPLPIQYTLKNSKKADRIMQILNGERITENEAKQIIDLVINSRETNGLKKEMRSLIKEESHLLHSINLKDDVLLFLLRSMMEDL